MFDYGSLESVSENNKSIAFRGTLKAPFLALGSVPIYLQEQIKHSDFSPDYIACLHNGAPIGKVWSKVSKKGNNYMSFKVDMPDMREACQCMVFEDEARSGHYNISWSRPNRKDASQTQSNQSIDDDIPL